MRQIMDWIQDNKEWLFSGLGVFLLGLLFAFSKKRKKQKNTKMKQKSGSDSTNIQIGGDYNGK
jgi:LPXTG-motif cell wall-anchored protein